MGNHTGPDGAVKVDPNDRQSWKSFGTVGVGREMVYRLYGRSGDLLYVGITWNPFARWTRHADTKAWWHEVDSASTSIHQTVREARQEESRAIHAEFPRYNIHQVPRVVMT